MSDQIQPGDIVTLKSGGPEMTVSWVEEGDALCQWFDSKNMPQSQVYALVVLEKS
ncbi:DUF2158 domain-containing protein [Salinisphaera sp. S4-8]|uniref:YodC family protein n=1 Tax=Salinisphaera sp. S4-8 TaxID=633357 RepID=UPI003340F38E